MFGKLLIAATAVGVSRREDARRARQLETDRITGVVDDRPRGEEPVLVLRNDTVMGGAVCIGDLVRLIPSSRLDAPWNDYANVGLPMRVRTIDTRRGTRCVNLQRADAETRSLQYIWVREADIEPWEDDAPSLGLREKLDALRARDSKAS